MPSHFDWQLSGGRAHPDELKRLIDSTVGAASTAVVDFSFNSGVLPLCAALAVTEWLAATTTTGIRELNFSHTDFSAAPPHSPFTLWGGADEETGDEPSEPSPRRCNCASLSWEMQLWRLLEACRSTRSEAGAVVEVVNVEDCFALPTSVAVAGAAWLCGKLAALEDLPFSAGVKISFRDLTSRHAVEASHTVLHRLNAMMQSVSSGAASILPPQWRCQPGEETSHSLLNPQQPAKSTLATQNANAQPQPLVSARRVPIVCYAPVPILFVKPPKPVTAVEGTGEVKKKKKRRRKVQPAAADGSCPENAAPQSSAVPKASESLPVRSKSGVFHTTAHREVNVLKTAHAKVLALTKLRI